MPIARVACDRKGVSGILFFFADVFQPRGKCSVANLNVRFTKSSTKFDPNSKFLLTLYVKQRLMKLLLKMQQFCVRVYACLLMCSFVYVRTCMRV